MARGNRSCSRLCKICRCDCYCEACEHCHYCTLEFILNKGVLSHDNIVKRCKGYKHDCGEEDAIQKMTKNMRKAPRLFSSEIIEIAIGKDSPEKRFVPKSALIEHAEYFKGYFSFEERASSLAAPVGEEGDIASPSSARKVLKLDTEVDRPDAFDCFIQFIYWNNYDTDEEPDELALHAHVYVLAERLQATDLKTLAVRKASPLLVSLSEQINNSITFRKSALQELCSLPAIIETVYSNTPSTSEPTIYRPLVTSEDTFREILSVFGATCLRDLGYIDGFLECLRTVPDFMLDVMARMKRACDLRLDQDGVLMHKSPGC